MATQIITTNDSSRIECANSADNNTVNTDDYLNKDNNGLSDNRNEIEVISRRIDANKISFYGRKEELQLLHNIYDEVCRQHPIFEETPVIATTATATTAIKTRNSRQQHQQKEQERQKNIPVTLISGLSGSGKSTLVDHFLNELKNKLTKNKKTNQKNNWRNNKKKGNITKKKSNEHFFSMSGKFNELHCEAPFSAIVEALSTFSTDLLKGDKTLLKQVRSDINESLGNEAINVLTTVVPDLIEVMIDDDDIDDGSSGGGGHSNQNQHHDGDDDDSRKKRQRGDFFNPVENAWNHLKHVFLTFVNAVSSETHPVIMFFDDLQWADNASLDLITSLLIDTSIRHVMFIGSCRSNDINDDHPLSKSLVEVSVVHPVKRINLLNLSIKEMGNCIYDLLEIKTKGEEEQKDYVVPLIEIIYNKTKGNVFFAIQIIKEIERKNILYYSNGTTRWEWNLKEIKNIDHQSSSSLSSSSSTSEEQLENSNVIVEMVIDKIKNTLPKKLQIALTVAAHTHSQIDIDTLQTLMSRTMGCIVRLQELAKLLDHAVLEGMLINVMGSKNYKFAHNHIRQASYMLQPVGKKKNELREKIGLFLFHSWLAGDRKDWMLFVAADHLNEVYNINSSVTATSEGSIESNSNDSNKIRHQKQQRGDPVKMTMLNLEIGERSIKIAALRSASEYLRKALSALKRIKDHWKNYHDLCLRVYRALSDVELYLGRYEIGHTYAQEVFNHVKDLRSALPTYRALAVALGRQLKHEKALDMYWDVLAVVGENRESVGSMKVPKLLYNLLREMRYLKNHTDAQLLSLPMMTDENKLAAMGFYTEASTQAYLSGNLLDWMFITFRRLRLTFEYGLSGHSSLAFGHVASVFGGNDHSFALRLSNLARQMIEITRHMNSTKIEPNTILCLSFLTEGWSNDYSVTISNLLHARKVGMEIGDLEFGLSSWSFAIHTSFMAGEKRLDSLLTQCNMLKEQQELYNITTLVKITEQMQLRLQYLTGQKGGERGEERTEHQPQQNKNEAEDKNSDKNNKAGGGSYCDIDWDKLKDFGPETNGAADETYRLVYGYISRLALSVYFGEYGPHIVQWMKLWKKSSEHDTSFEGSLLGSFYAGLALSGLSRKQKSNKNRRKYIYMARKEAKTIKQLIKKRQVPSNHRYLIMESDLMLSEAVAAVSTKTKENIKLSEKIRENFTKAINVSMETNHYHDAALCNELAGEYFLLTKDKELATEHFSLSRTLYDEWGALAKVDHLQRKHGLYLKKISNAVVRTKAKKNNNIDSSPLLLSSSIKNLQRTQPSSNSSTISFASLPEELQLSWKKFDDVDGEEESKTTNITDANSYSGKTAFTF